MNATQGKKDHELFLPDAVSDRFRNASSVRSFPPHTLIFKQDDPPTGFLYLIKSGSVEILVPSPGDVEMIVDYRYQGQFFGGTPVFTGERYTAGARTLEPTECYLVPVEVVRETEKEFPQLRDYFTRVVLTRVKHLYSGIVAEHSRKALTQVEAFPFQKRLSEIMSSPAETCPLGESVQEVARRMSDMNISSVIVLEEDGSPAGIVTEKDIISKVVARGKGDPTGVSAAEVMTPHPYAMAPEEKMYEAMSYMLGHRIKHLPVVHDGRAVGMVTMRDLMRFRSEKAMLLVGSAKEAETIDDLVVIRAQVVKVAKALVDKTSSPFETMEILSYIHHCILRRCFEIVLEEMKGEGLTPPDIRFCVIIMGSGGRKEMLLGPDQDNGLIYEDFPDSMQEEVDAFFAPFTERLVHAFERIGYPLCNGKVMLNNPVWRGRLKEWRERIDKWLSVPEPKRVMYSTIFFDFMPLAGDPSLSRTLRDIVKEKLRGNEWFLWYLLENELSHKPPLGLLGRFIVERSGDRRGQLSLKQAGSVFIVDCLRMFMLEKGFEATTTVERLSELVKLGVFKQEAADHIKVAFEAFIYLRLRNEIALIDKDQPPSHFLDPYALSPSEQDLLKEALRVVGKLQDSARRHFGQGVL